VALASPGTRAHQGVLQDRESILVVPGSKEEAVADGVVDLAVVERGRLVDGTQQGKVIQPWDKVLTRIDCLGEALEAGALAEIVRAHGENDEQVRGGILFAGQGAKQFGQEFGLLAALLLRIAEQLLELVDEEAQGRSFGTQRCFNVVEYRRPQGQARMPGGDGIDRLTRARRRAKMTGQSRRQIAQGTARRPLDRSQPMAAPTLLDFQQWQNAGPHQRGFSRARGSVDDDQVFPGKAVDDRVNHFLAAEENPVLLRFERPQARIGFSRQGHPRRHRGCGERCHDAGSALEDERPRAVSNSRCHPPDVAGTHGTS
jgi:hypothetical protein